MQVIFNKEKQLKPIKAWANHIEEGALEQAVNLSNLPFLFKHVALMPDVHQGYGMPIGGVIACERTVIPNAVGVDIGCGMCAVQTPWTTKDISRGQLERIIYNIKELIPIGFNHNKKMCDINKMPEFIGGEKIVLQQYENARKQLGTLGGGNHFIEIQKNEDDYIWVMIHSGSRNLGFKVANHYNTIAKEMNKRWHVGIPKSHDLAYLPITEDYAQCYMNEMQYCVDFALANREQMMKQVKIAFDKVMGWRTIDLTETINIAHNYAAWENHYGKNVLVHRKGATLARKGTIGIIPGSQGTSSYIVEGLGNPLSFNSCSHGAGRILGRAQAKKTLSLAQEVKKLDDLGIIHGIKSNLDLDEAPGAYKDIDIVMENQKDLVKIKTKLTPMAVIKG